LTPHFKRIYDSIQSEKAREFHEEGKPLWIFQEGDMKPKVLFMMLVLMIGWAWNAAVCEGQSGKGQ